MPIDNIPINRGSAQGNELAGVLTNLWQTKGQLEKILANMVEQNGGGDWTTLETQFGIPTGQGEAAYGLVFAIANGNPASPSGFGDGSFTQFMNRLN